jgi:hypothetical protein
MVPAVMVEKEEKEEERGREDAPTRDPADVTGSRKGKKVPPTFLSPATRLSRYEPLLILLSSHCFYDYVRAN